MGGLLALMLAARGLAAAAVLLTPAPPAGVWSLTANTLFLALQRIHDLGFWKRPLRPSWREARRSLYHKIPAEEARDLYDRLVFESGQALFEIIAWPIDRRHASKIDTSKIHCPVYIAAAKDDRIVPPAVCQRIARKVGPKAQLTVLPDLGHWCLSGPGWEAAARFMVGALDAIERREIGLNRR